MRRFAALVTVSFLLLSALRASAAPFQCAEATPRVPVNPGCFRSFEPPSDGDCTTSASQFFVQAIVPDLDEEHRVVSLRFWSNDGSTVFPSAGVLVSSFVTNDEILLPSPEQLLSLHAHNVSSGADTAQVLIDLQAASLVVPAGTNVVLFAVVQFPAAGKLTQVGTGPGILADASLPDQDCDFFSLDTGTTWQAPFFIPEDPEAEPLDWGFVIHLEPVTAVESVTWSNLKRLYRSP